MTLKNESIDVKTYQQLQNMAFALVGDEEGGDLAQDAVLTTIISRNIYPNKPLIILMRESLGVNYARLCFGRLHEQETETSLEQEYRSIKANEEDKKIIYRNFDRMSDLEKLVALKLLREPDPNKVAEKIGVGVSCINAYTAVINYNISKGTYK